MNFEQLNQVIEERISQEWSPWRNRKGLDYVITRIYVQRTFEEKVSLAELSIELNTVPEKLLKEIRKNYDDESYSDVVEIDLDNNLIYYSNGEWSLKEEEYNDWKYKLDTRIEVRFNKRAGSLTYHFIEFRLGDVALAKSIERNNILEKIGL